MGFVSPNRKPIDIHLTYSRFIPPYHVIQTRRLQDNSVDCGVWVLACIAAVLQGFTSVDLDSEEIADFRRRLLALVYTTAHVI